MGISVEIKHLNYRYPYSDFNVFSDFSLIVNNGEYRELNLDFGKTTMAKILGGLIKNIENDTIFFDSIDIKSYDYKNGGIGVIFNDFALLNGSVRYNIAYPLKIRNLQKEYIDNMIREISNKYQLDSIIDTNIKKLTHFQKAIVSVARIDMRPLKLLVLDNIYNELNEEEDNIIKNYIYGIHKEKAVTVIDIKANRE